MIKLNYKIDPHIRTKPEDLLPSLVSLYITDFDDKSVKEVADAVSRAQNTGQTVLPVAINSYGGSVYDVLAMADILQTSKVPVATIALGKAMSAGSILFSCGAPGMRFISPNSTVMIHEAATWRRGKTEDMKADVRELERAENLIFGMLDRNCGKPDGYFKSLVDSHKRADWYLSPEQCVEHGLASRIGLPSLTVKVDVSYSFDKP